MVRNPRNHIHATLAHFNKTDPFVQKLLRISENFQRAPVDNRQNIHMLILRSDYMVDAPSRSLKLVEFNTIAAALSSLS
jgi:hypothetical protein